MATTSYPAVGTGGLTPEQWSAMYGGRDGIIEDYTACHAFDLTVNEAANTVHIGPGIVTVNGYALEVDSAGVDLSTPAATTTAKVYYVAAQYDPALNVADGDLTRSDLGPCRLVVGTSLSTTGGKAYTLLWRVTRQASELLADAALAESRRWIGPVLVGESVPVTTFGNDYPAGSVFVQNNPNITSPGILYRWRNDAGTALVWKSYDDTAEFPFPAPGSLVAVDTPATYYKTGRQVQIFGTLKRSNGTNLSTGADVILGTMPDGYRADGVRRFSCPTNSGSATVRVFASGQVIMSNPATTCLWIDLSPISYRAA